MNLTPLERAVLVRVSRDMDPYGPTTTPNGARQVAAVLDRLKDKGALTLEIGADGVLEYLLTSAARATLEHPE